MNAPNSVVAAKLLWGMVKNVIVPPRGWLAVGRPDPIRWNLWRRAIKYRSEGASLKEVGMRVGRSGSAVNRYISGYGTWRWTGPWNCHAHRIEPDMRNEISDFPGLSVRTRNALLRQGFSTWEEVAAVSYEEMLEWENFGRVSLDEVRRALVFLGKSNAHRLRPPLPQGFQ